MKRALVLALAVLVFVLSLSGAALAATPQDIYNDFADNGRLDGTYTRAELEAYLNDAMVHQYGDPAVLGPLDRLVRKMLAGTSDDRDTFPWTGLELAALIAGAVILIGGGIALRRARR